MPVGRYFDVDDSMTTIDDDQGDRLHYDERELEVDEPDDEASGWGDC